MIRIFRSWEEVDKIDLFAQVDKVLNQRADLWERYSRGLSFENYQDKSITKENLQILFEKFIVDIAAGYSAGIYAGYYTLRDYIATDELADYVPIWYVQYSNSCDFAEVCSHLRMVAWQYTDSGRIDGWDYGIDFDEWYE